MTNLSKLSLANEARLRAAIADYELQTVEELIVDLSVECATLLTTVPEDYAKVGTSRYGGVPDLPDENVWPKTGDGEFYNFLMQINLADVPDFVGNVLPRRGMLYAFFADYDDMVVIWADVEPMGLTRAQEKTPDHFLGGCNEAPNPYQLEIRTAINPPLWYSLTYRKIEDATEGAEDFDDFARSILHGHDLKRFAGKLGGQPDYIGYDPNDGYDDGQTVPEGYGLLWTLDTEDAVGVTHGDAGYIQIFIKRDALEKRDFLSVFPRLESS